MEDTEFRGIKDVKYWTEEESERRWVSTAVPWKPWTWGRGHWQFDYEGTGPTRWWNRHKVRA